MITSKNETKRTVITSYRHHRHLGTWNKHNSFRFSTDFRGEPKNKNAFYPKTLFSSPTTIIHFNLEFVNFSLKMIFCWNLIARQCLRVVRTRVVATCVWVFFLLIEVNFVSWIVFHHHHYYQVQTEPSSYISRTRDHAKKVNRIYSINNFILNHEMTIIYKTKQNKRWF